MTIFVTWQSRVTLDSIRNSCDVLYLKAPEFFSFWAQTAVCALLVEFGIGWKWMWYQGPSISNDLYPASVLISPSYSQILKLYMDGYYCHRSSEQLLPNTIWTHPPIWLLSVTYLLFFKWIWKGFSKYSLQNAQFYNSLTLKMYKNSWEPICCKILRNIWWVWNWHRSYTSNVNLCENLLNIYLQNGFSDISRINEIYKCGPWGDVTTLNIRAHGDH